MTSPSTPLRGNTAAIALCGVFAALTAICSQIAIPLPFTPVPVNLATLSVFLAGGLLGSRLGSLSQFIYVVMGLVGLPVFAQFSGGPGIVLGPTGGYIIGYLFAAFVGGFLLQRQATRANRPADTSGVSRFFTAISTPLCLAVALFACYLPGTLWFLWVTGSTLPAALAMCVIPFLPGDFLKILLASWLIDRLRPTVRSILG